MKTAASAVLFVCLAACGAPATQQVVDTFRADAGDPHALDGAWDAPEFGVPGPECELYAAGDEFLLINVQDHAQNIWNRGRWWTGTFDGRQAVVDATYSVPGLLYVTTQTFTFAPDFSSCEFINSGWVFYMYVLPVPFEVTTRLVPLRSGWSPDA